MINFIKSATNINNYPDSNAEIIFIGKSNVGKSSIINCLYGKKTAYVGKTPGKTKMLNFFDVDNKYTFVDAPGYGYAKRSEKEIILFGEMMEEYFSKRNCLKLAIMIIDARHKPTNDDLDMKEYLNNYQIPYVIIANKIDKLSNNELFNNKKMILDYLNLDDNHIIFVSATKKTNIDKLKEIINESILKS